MRIGNREVVHTELLIIPSSEDAWIEFRAGDWNVKLNVVFETSSDHEQGITIEGIEDYGKIKFINWNNSLGTATATPVELGKTKGQPLVFMATHNLIGTVHRLDIQFMLGDAL